MVAFLSRRTAAATQISRATFSAVAAWRCYCDPKSSATPQCHRMPNLLIIGPSNNGKTMIANKFCMVHPPEKENILNDKFVSLKDTPVLYMQMPANPGMKRFYAEILHKLDLPSQSTERLIGFESECTRYMKVCNIRMLIIDELHNILSAPKNKQQELLNVLRYLGNELQVPIVGLGTKDAYLAIRTDRQLENRFEPYLLPLWKTGQEYNSLLASFVAIMPLKKKSNLTIPQLAKKILVMSEGITGEITAIITKAAILATELDSDMDEMILNNIEYASPSIRRKTFESGLM